MLSGVRTGKKRKRRQPPPEEEEEEKEHGEGGGQVRDVVRSTFLSSSDGGDISSCCLVNEPPLEKWNSKGEGGKHPATTKKALFDNVSAAEELRRQLALASSSSSFSSSRTATTTSNTGRMAGGSFAPACASDTHSPSSDLNGRNEGCGYDEGKGERRSENSLAVDSMERRGRIIGSLLSGNATRETEGAPADDSVLVLTGGAASSKPPSYEKEDLRYGSRRRGKLRPTNDVSSTKDMTIEEMIAEERRAGSSTHHSRSMDETYARNIARLGSRYRGSDFATKGSSAAAHEEDDNNVDMTMFTPQSSNLTQRARWERDRARQIAFHDEEKSITSKCWWWMESSNFSKHMLLALGDHVSLVLAPTHLALVKGQCYLVPVKHSESFVSCEDEVWDEIQRFRTSLRAMFAKNGEKKGVLFCETVLPSSKGLWQTRMDVIPVPKRVEQDAPIYFKSALAEQAEEWGTHTKLLSTKDKGLRRTVPKNFPYFNVEWNGGGYAQIIESTSFPKDFGVDTIAGMMGLDPPRFNRKPKAADEDRGAVLDFCGRWKEFDWTLELDGEAGSSSKT